MNAYLDANVYVAYFLGEQDEGLIDALFQTSLECRFSITSSLAALWEVQKVCQGNSSALIQHHFDAFKRADKFRVIESTPQDVAWAIQMNERSNATLGVNDWLHIRLASVHSDILVSKDRRMLEFSKPWIRSTDVKCFLQLLKG